MLNQLFINRLDQSACFYYKELAEADLELTNRRIDRIRAKQEKEPNFESYDVWADGMVDIDTRLEEQLAVVADIEYDIELLDEHLKNLADRAENERKQLLKPHVIQLKLFESVVA